jgi:hypothetical protein
MPHQDYGNLHEQRHERLKFSVVVLSQMNSNDQQLEREKKEEIITSLRIDVLPKPSKMSE